MRRLPMQWFCEIANAVIGEGGELLEYRHLIANPTMRATWLHLYRNEIGRLAQGMPGRNTGTNMIVFIHKNQVPRNRAKDLLESTELTLNLLRQSRITPKVSAFAHVHGQHDYMRKPFAPIGCAIQTHIKPDDCRTWDTRS